MPRSSRPDTPYAARAWSSSLSAVRTKSPSAHIRTHVCAHSAIQKRGDAKRYALGVLGLGSLSLTQLRYEHGDILKTE